jgi:hypothetical protein
MIAYILIGALAAAALMFVLAPVRAGTGRDLPHGTFARDEAEERKRAALTALLDLETERDVGKLEDEEFVTLRTEYEAEAVAALDDLDRLGPPGTAETVPEDDALEAEIARIRAKLRS